MSNPNERLTSIRALRWALIRMGLKEEDADAFIGKLREEFLQDNRLQEDQARRAFCETFAKELLERAPYYRERAETKSSLGRKLFELVGVGLFVSVTGNFLTDFLKAMRGSSSPSSQLEDELQAQGRVEQAIADQATRLDLSGLRLIALPKGIAGLTELRALDLNYTRVRDIRLLAGLIKLQDLLLRDTEISDLSAVATLSGLQTLLLDGSPVENLRPIAGSIHLEHLDLISTPVSDPRPLEKLIHLQTLLLARTRLTCVKSLAGLTSLQNLNLSSTRISDVKSLAGLIKLCVLRLDATLVSDLTPLAGLTNLLGLNLGDTPVSDLRPLAHLPKLRDLYLVRTCVSDLGPLAGLTSLRHLYLDRAAVNVKPLAGLTKLTIHRWPPRSSPRK